MIRLFEDGDPIDNGFAGIKVGLVSGDEFSFDATSKEGSKLAFGLGQHEYTKVWLGMATRVVKPFSSTSQGNTKEKELGHCRGLA